MTQSPGNVLGKQISGVLKLIRSTSLSPPLSTFMNTTLGGGLTEVDNLRFYGT